jgi:DNA-binding CsgD family transcriptional regulator
MTVPPLGYVDMQTLLAETLGAPIDSQAVARVFAASGGLPGLALPLVAGARQHGSLRLVGGAWTAGPDIWTPELTRAVDPLMHRLTPESIDGLHALALAGTTDVPTARRLVTWDVLEELDGYRLLRFVPRDDDLLVSVFPLAIVEYFRHLGVGARHLKVDETLKAAFGGTVPPRPVLAQSPWQRSDAAPVGAPDDTDVIVNRMLQEHWHRELLVRRAEWERTPAPRTAAALIRTMLVTDADPQEVLAVREATGRTGSSRDLVAFDDWYALFVGAVEHNVEWVHDVLDQARADADEWTDLVDAVEKFIVLLIDHAPDPAQLPEAPCDAPADTAEIVGTARSELLLAQGRSRDALEQIAKLGAVTSDFARARVTSRAWATYLEGELDEALALAQDQLSQARREHDVEGIVGAAYVAANVLLTRGRTSDLRRLLSSVLSTGVIPALQRPQYVALLSIAATVAADEGRATTARTLVQQALALRVGPGPFPLGSPTRAAALLDGADLAPAAARSLTAGRLWEETVALLANGYALSGWVCGMLAVIEEPTAQRGAVLREVAARIPAPLIASHAELVDALCNAAGNAKGNVAGNATGAGGLGAGPGGGPGGGPASGPASGPTALESIDALLAVAGRHASAGLVWSATIAYQYVIAALRASGAPGAPARAGQVRDEARRRLAAWGDEAVAGLSSAAEGAELTAREEEIARLAVSGLTNQDIAKRLLISVRTVENHLHRVFRKLGVESRAELARVLAG